MLISITQFKLKSWWLYPAFFLDTYRVVKQVKRSGGLIRMRIKPFTLRTLTAWDSEDQMLTFRNNNAHLQVMKKTRDYGTINSASWESSNIPDWSEAISRLDNHRQDEAA